ncbi:MAG: hypothetical protein GY816_01565, partial [Cytophagales bacterium]|nr:hypothetical protein [Cytophagales bacterium]
MKEQTAAILSAGRIKEICSHTYSPRCSNKPVQLKLNRIELFNGTQVYVSNSDVHWVETTSEQYECKGEGLFTGTPAFCANHKCHHHGTKFCYYPTDQIAFYSNAVGMLPIKAYGIVEAAAYPYKSATMHSTRCLECSLLCIKGGVQITLNKNVHFMEICALPFCYKMSFPAEEENVMLPASINLADHDVTVRLWSKGFLIKSFGTTCSSQPFCEMIDCYFCMARIKNIHCSSTMALVLMAISLYFITITLYVLATLTTIIFKLAIILLKVIKHCFCCLCWVGLCCRKLCRRVRNRTYQSTILPIYTMVSQDETKEDEGFPRALSKQQQGFSKQTTNKASTEKKTAIYSKLPYFLAMLAIFSPTSNACAEVASLTAGNSVCTAYKDGQLECTIDETTRLALAPQGQQACLLVQSPLEEPIGTIELEVRHISLICQKKTEYYTSSYQMKHQAVKRCPGAGSCYDVKCRFIRPYSPIEEFDEIVNTSPGFTYCQEACGCFGCGCFLCESGCLFYRTYAVPLNEKVYEVFSCPRWHYNVEVIVRVSEENSTRIHNVTLLPGTPIHWDNMGLTLTSISTPPSPILGTQFMTDGTVTVMTRASAAGQPISGAVGSLQCSNKKAAQDFDCALPHDSCLCNFQDDKYGKVTCACVHGDLTNVIANDQHILPMVTQGISIMPVPNKGVTAEFDQISVLEVQMTFQGFKLRT